MWLSHSGDKGDRPCQVPSAATPQVPLSLPGLLCLPICCQPPLLSVGRSGRDGARSLGADSPVPDGTLSSLSLASWGRSNARMPELPSPRSHCEQVSRTGGTGRSPAIFRPSSSRPWLRWPRAPEPSAAPDEQADCSLGTRGKAGPGGRARGCPGSARQDSALLEAAGQGQPGVPPSVRPQACLASA